MIAPLRSLRMLTAGVFLPLLIGGCGTGTVARPAHELPAVSVFAKAETDPVGTDRLDAADDPAIWRNAADPVASWIIGTDKKAGIYVYGLDGHQRSFIAAGALNNADLRGDVRWGGRDIILVGASDRTDRMQPKVALFMLDPANGALASLGSYATSATGEAYGFCLGRLSADDLRAYVVVKPGRVLELTVRSDATGSATVALRRSFGVATQAEGCVVDDRTGQLYLGEEDVGIWRFDLKADHPTPIAFAHVGAKDGLVADVEGLALAPEGESGGMLVASSQGDNAYTVFDLTNGALVSRFRIQAGTIDGTFDTDGIELALGDFGPEYPEGIFVAQDGDNLPDAQNFKLLSWKEILETTVRR